MNIHPLLVHFPVATFYIYAIIEIFAFDKRFHSLLGAKRLLLVLSFLSAIPTLITGLLAQSVTGGTANPLIQTHKTFAIIFAILTLLLVFGMMGAIIKGKNMIILNKWQKFLVACAFLGSRPGRFILALIGIILVTIVGALGGLIVYGPSIDPFSTWIYGLVVK